MMSTRHYYLRMISVRERPWWRRGAREEHNTILIEVGEDGLMEREVILDADLRPVESNLRHGWTETIKFDVCDLALGRAPEGCTIIDADEFENYWQRSGTA